MRLSCGGELDLSLHLALNIEYPSLAWSCDFCANMCLQHYETYGRSIQAALTGTRRLRRCNVVTIGLGNAVVDGTRRASVGDADGVLSLTFSGDACAFGLFFFFFCPFG